MNPEYLDRWQTRGLRIARILSTSWGLNQIETHVTNDGGPNQDFASAAMKSHPMLAYGNNWNITLMFMERGEALGWLLGTRPSFNPETEVKEGGMMASLFMVTEERILWVGVNDAVVPRDRVRDSSTMLVENIVSLHAGLVSSSRGWVPDYIMDSMATRKWLIATSSPLMGELFRDYLTLHRGTLLGYSLNNGLHVLGERTDF